MIYGMRQKTSTVQSFWIDPTTGTTTQTTDSFAYTGGSNGSLFAVNPNSDEFYIATTTELLYRAKMSTGELLESLSFTGTFGGNAIE